MDEKHKPIFSVRNASDLRKGEQEQRKRARGCVPEEVVGQSEEEEEEEGRRKEGGGGNGSRRWKMEGTARQQPWKRGRSRKARLSWFRVSTEAEAEAGVALAYVHTPTSKFFHSKQQHCMYMYVCT